MCGTDPYTYGVSIIRKCDSIPRIDFRNDTAAFIFIIIKVYFSLSQNTIFKGNVISCLEQEKQQKVIEIHVLYEHLRNILHAILFYTHTICCLQGQNPPSFCFARKTTRLSSSFTSSIGRNGTTMSRLVFMIQYICSSSLSSPPNPSSSAKYCPSG